ncbi:MAG TPA: DUF6093 family protein [Acidimicrobiia bacterium]
MSVDAAIAFFRDEQENVFRDAAKIELPGTGDPVLDPETGVLVPPARTQTYSGPCLIRGVTWEGTNVEAGEADLRLRVFNAKFPVDTPVEIFAIVTPTASTYDGSLVGREFWVTDVLRDGWQISRSVICKEVTG